MYKRQVQCEGGCDRWFHYLCCGYPALEQLGEDWADEMERLAVEEKFYCPSCRLRDPAGWALSPGYQRLLALRADALPRCALSDTIEEHLAAELQANHVTAEGLVVRVVAAKWAEYKAVSGMKERYDGTDRAYPDGFPYRSKALLAFQRIEGRDVAFFAMYVQEYGAHCPQPNTNRTYVSYLDSVRWLRTEPKGQRSLVYHAIINGYLKHATARGFQYAHIWVAPPQAGDEYIFHCRPKDERHGNKPMSMSKLRTWYEAMLNRARELGVVEQFTDIYEHVEHLTSVRDFPVFEGDFFPDHLRELLQPHSPALKPGKPGRDKGPALGGGEPPPPLKRDSSNLVIEGMKKQSKSFRKRFLVAKLNAPADGAAAQETEEEELSGSLLDARYSFLGHCQTSHWQFDDLERAHYTTMMVLAMLLKAPAADSRPPSAMAEGDAAQPAIEELS